MSRWASAWSSDWVSCWPWRSTSSAPSSPSTAAVVGLPFTHARERPSAETSRRTTSRPSSTSRPSASIARAGEPVHALEGALDDRLGRAGTNAAARRPLAEQQRERVDQHGLAGAGLAGEHVEPGAELKGDVGDGGEVADPELGDHARGLALGQIAPVQLLPHPAEEAVAAEPDEAHPVVGPPHVDALARRERAAGLAVERDQQVVGPARHRLDHDAVGAPARPADARRACARRSGSPRSPRRRARRSGRRRSGCRRWSPSAWRR